MSAAGWRPQRPPSHVPRAAIVLFLLRIRDFRSVLLHANPGFQTCRGRWRYGRLTGRDARAELPFLCMVPATAAGAAGGSTGRRMREVETAKSAKLKTRISSTSKR